MHANGESFFRGIMKMLSDLFQPVIWITPVPAARDNEERGSEVILAISGFYQRWQVITFLKSLR